MSGTGEGEMGVLQAQGQHGQLAETFFKIRKGRWGARNAAQWLTACLTCMIAWVQSLASMGKMAHYRCSGFCHFSL